MSDKVTYRSPYLLDQKYKKKRGGIFRLYFVKKETTQKNVKFTGEAINGLSRNYPLYCKWSIWDHYNFDSSNNSFAINTKVSLKSVFLASVKFMFCGLSPFYKIAAICCYLVVTSGCLKDDSSSRFLLNIDTYIPN